jgi:acetoin utilization protein AcuC
MPSRASGFCHVNDVVLAINTLLETVNRVVYIDIDAHHGDGVQHAFYEMDSVLTISIHQSGYTIFPGTGFVQEIGKGKGEGFSVNVPLLPGAGDDAYSLVWDEIVFPLIVSFDPDILVTQLGADALSNDRIARLDMSLSCFEGFVDSVYRLKKPWLALGGGGYAVENVVRAWTLAWARMNGVTLPDEIPENWLSKVESEGLRVESLRDKADPVASSGPVLNDLNRTLEALHGSVFPIIENSRARRSN